MKLTKFKRQSPVFIAVILVLTAAGAVFWKVLPAPPANKTGEERALFKENDPSNQAYESSGDASLGDGSNITFKYPQKFIINREDLGEGAARIVAESAEERKGFEINILPFDEQGPLTAQRITQDLPDMRLDNVKDITIGGGAEALAFDSADENIGNTHEVWFVRNGYLYQAITYDTFGAELEAILGTFKFK